MNFKKILIFLTLFLFFQKISFSQLINEIVPPGYIKTIIFKGLNESHQFPIITINEPLILSFDDLRGSDENYYYKFSYYDNNWIPSKLFKNEFIDGFDNQRITDITSSFGTKQIYSHYEIKFPNEKTRFLKSGNYKIGIYDQNDNLIFERKFLVYDNNTIVNATVSSSRDLKRFKSHQSIQFTIKPLDISIENPLNEISVVIIQNYQWDIVINKLKPQYIINKELQYRYDIPLQFEGGNEYYFFDTKNILAESQNISYVSNEDLYQTYLYTNIERNSYPYNYNQDINGDFKISTISGNNEKIESDYSKVHFSLAKSEIRRNEEIYVYGKFNNYLLSNENLMTFNPSLEVYETSIILKQGFYNYKYVSKTSEKLLKNAISGSHYKTENKYQIFVYYRPKGSIYESLIGFGVVSSFNLNNSSIFLK